MSRLFSRGLNSVWPTLFLLYTADVIAPIEEYGHFVHAYADDLRVYNHMDPTQSAQLLVQMAERIARIEAWMASNRLHLTPSKTKLIWLGSRRRLLQCTTNAIVVSGASIQL